MADFTRPAILSRAGALMTGPTLTLGSRPGPTGIDPIDFASIVEKRSATLAST